MLIKETLQLIVKGANFDPFDIAVPEKINIVQRNRIGDVITYGRDKGGLTEEGFIILDGKIEDVLALIDIYNSLLKEMTIDVSLSLLVMYEGDCNFELTADQIIRISRLGVPIGISCYPQ